MDMKIAVIYKSKTGFTKKYAEWIAEAVSADIFEISTVHIPMLDIYDTIIYGGSVHISEIIGVKLITENMDRLANKRLIVFAIGVSPLRKSVVMDVQNKNFDLMQQKKIKFFYLRGGFDYSKLNFLDKFLMTLLKWKIKRKNKINLTADEIGMLAIYDKPADFTMKENIDTILNIVRGDVC